MRGATLEGIGSFSFFLIVGLSGILLSLMVEIWVLNNEIQTGLKIRPHQMPNLGVEIPIQSILENDIQLNDSNQTLQVMDDKLFFSYGLFSLGVILIILSLYDRGLT